eukprot:snap_masked-scaffold_42-processed-gene-2.54-mRNA-1 protein AED:1.00 eAED:1.00 QI:0/0/0/0/1/1/2/0/252
MKKGYKSYKDALASNTEWEKSYLDEMTKLEEQGELKIVPRRREMKCIPFREVLTEKIDNISGAVKRKVRLAARGDLQFDRPENCYSPAAVRCTRAVKKIIGLQLDRGSLSVAIHQNEKIHDMGTRYRTTKFPSKPMIENLRWDGNSVALDNIKPLQKLFGELNYLITMSRPDISYSVNRIARRIYDGTKEVYRRAKSILVNHCDTSNFVLIMKRFSGVSKLELYCYDGVADDKLEKISDRGFLIFLSGGLVH